MTTKNKRALLAAHFAEILWEPYHKKVLLPIILNEGDLIKKLVLVFDVHDSKGHSNHQLAKARLAKQLTTQFKIISSLYVPPQEVGKYCIYKWKPAGTCFKLSLATYIHASALYRS